MNRRARRILAFTGVVLVIVALTGFVFVRNRDSELKNRFDRIRFGMTQSQVEAIMGGPLCKILAWENVVQTPPLQGWLIGDELLEVDFGDSDSLCWKRFTSEIKNPTEIEILFGVFFGTPVRSPHRVQIEQSVRDKS